MSEFSILANVHALTPPIPRAAELVLGVSVLREARECACSGDAAVIYGRIDSLIAARQEELARIYQDASAEQPGPKELSE